MTITIISIINVFLFIITAQASDTTKHECIELYEQWDDEHKEYLKAYCDSSDVNEAYILGILYNESRFNHDAIGKNTNGTRDWGIGQCNDVTLSFLSDAIGIKSMEELLDTHMGITASVSIFKYHQDNTTNNDDALLRYQVGEGNFTKYRNHKPNVFYGVKKYIKEFEQYIMERDMKSYDVDISKNFLER